MTVGYGHGIAVTPLHLASAYAAMVNGGIWRPATLRKLEPDAAAPRYILNVRGKGYMLGVVAPVAGFNNASTADDVVATARHARGQRAHGEPRVAEIRQRGLFVDVVQLPVLSFELQSPLFELR